MVKKGVQLRASPEFLHMLKKLKIKIYANGEEISMRDLTKRMAEPVVFNKIEELILQDIIQKENSILRLDKR